MPDGTYLRIQAAEGIEALDSQMYFAGRVNIPD
jgi:hypothetical protein